MNARHVGMNTLGRLSVSLAYLQEIIDLSETLSFTETARRLNLSQPSLSRHVSLVEKAFGTLIFDRSSSSMSITEEGQALIEGAVSAMAELERAHNDAIALKKNRPVNIVIGGGVRTPRMQELVSRVKRDLKAEGSFRYAISYYGPHTSGNLFELSRLSPLKLLEDNLVDVIVGVRCDDERFLSETLYHEELVFLVPEDSLWVNKASIDLEDLKNQRFVFPLAFADFIGTFENLCNERGFTPLVDKRAVAYAGDAFIPHGPHEVFVTFKHWVDNHTYLELEDLCPLDMREMPILAPVRLQFRQDAESDALNLFVDTMVKNGAVLDADEASLDA